MRDYDPWVFGLLAEADHADALQHVARAQLARQAMASRAAQPSTAGAYRQARSLVHLVNGISAYSRLLFHRRGRVLPWSSWVTREQR